MNLTAKYDNHISINNIGKRIIKTTFSFRMAKASDVDELISEINTNKPMRTGLIPAKILTMLKESIYEPIEHVKNLMVTEGCFPDQAKISLITPAFEKDDRTFKTNYRPVSVLSALSKVLEKFLFKQMSDYFDNIFSEYLSGFRKGYDYHHILMRMIENWKNALDNKKVIAALSMDLSKAFDCLQHDLILAKLHAYGFEIQALKLIYSYLSNIFQSVKVKDTYSSTNKVKSDVPQGSLLGVILFNIQFNDIFDVIDEAELYNYADDNNLQL